MPVQIVTEFITAGKSGFWAVHVARMGEGRGVHRVRVGKPEGKRPLGRRRNRWEDSSKGLILGSIIKKDRFKMAAVVGLSTSRSEYFVRKVCMVFAWFK